MAKKGQIFNKYSAEFKETVLKDYRSGENGGQCKIAKKYSISRKTLTTWLTIERKGGTVTKRNQWKGVKPGRPSKIESESSYKEKYEILKKYQAFIKAQREKK